MWLTVTALAHFGLYIYVIIIISIYLATPIPSTNYTTAFFERFDGLFFADAGLSTCFIIRIRAGKMSVYFFKC